MMPALGPTLRYNDYDCTLLTQSGEWFLYHGKMVMRSFGAF
jgi:hypothetical protein